MAKKFENSSQLGKIERVLRRRGSDRYFSNDGWTNNPREAMTFNDAVDAAKVCAQYELRDVELVLRFETACLDVFCTRLR